MEQNRKESYQIHKENIADMNNMPFKKSIIGYIYKNNKENLKSHLHNYRVNKKL